MSTTSHRFDAIVLGGGISGLWILSRLRSQGYDAILLEKKSLGSGQTFASQGMIHGGIKYSLKGTTTGASESIADMPARWKACLEGRDNVNLKGVGVLSDSYYMFSDARLTSKLTAFLGSKAIEGRVNSVSEKDYPKVFQSPGFNGLLYQLQDLVVDARSLITHLNHQLKDYIYQGTARLERSTDGIGQLHLDDGISLCADTYVLAAGKGNAEMISDLALDVTMQLRPLHQVVVKHTHLPDLYAHAVTLRSTDKPRVTFTTHVSGNSRAWYLGGQIAETGTSRTESEQVAFAQKELALILPWVDCSQASFSTFRIDRAEAAQNSLLRPDTPYVRRHGNTIVCWPTKLTLAPMMGDMFMTLMPKASAKKKSAPLNLPTPTIGSSPWE